MKQLPDFKDRYAVWQAQLVWSVLTGEFAPACPPWRAFPREVVLFRVQDLRIGPTA